MWIITGLLVAIDSYIAYSIIVPVIGVLLALFDGLGRVRDFKAVTRVLAPSARRTHVKTATESFAKQVMPLCLKTQAAVEQLKARLDPQHTDAATQKWLKQASTLTAPWYCFGRAWNLMVQALREDDLISDAEMAILVFGKGNLGNRAQWPLCLVSGAAYNLVCQPNALLLLAGTGGDMRDTVDKFQPHSVDAIAELHESLPHILMLVFRSHPACSHAVIQHLEAILNVLFGTTSATAQQVILVILRKFDPSVVARACANLNTLLGAMINEGSEAGPNVAAAAGVNPTPTSTAAVAYSACADFLECAMGLMCANSSESSTAVPASVSLASSLAVCVAILRGSSQMENHSFLDRVREAGLLQEYSSSLEQIYRDKCIISYPIDAELKVQEAERRISFWVNSLLMPALPGVTSCLTIPTFSALTPHYAEAVMYDKVSVVFGTHVRL